MNWMKSRSLAMTMTALVGFVSLASTLGCNTPGAESAKSDTTMAPTSAMAQPGAKAPKALVLDYRVDWKPPVLPPSMRVGQSYPLEVAFANSGDSVWPDPRMADPAGITGGEHAVRLSYRWLKRDGTVLSDYKTRTELSRPLRPGESTALAIVVVAPEKPGEYQLQFDLVQEMVAWFGNKPGVQKLVVSMTVN